MTEDRAPRNWRGIERLTGTALEQILVGNTMTGRHRLLIRWAMFYRPDGTTAGQFTFLGRRAGRWWREGDFWCASWPMLDDGAPRRYVAFENGDRLKWFRTTGEAMANDRVVAGNPFGL